MGFVLEGYLEDLDCLGDSVPDMMFAEAKPLALFALIVVGEVLLLVEELPLLDRVGDPPGLEYISLEKVLGG